MPNAPISIEIELKDIFKLVHHDISEDIFKHVDENIPSSKEKEFAIDDIIELFADSAAEAYRTELSEKMKQKYVETIQRVSV